MFAELREQLAAEQLETKFFCKHSESVDLRRKSLLPHV